MRPQTWIEVTVKSRVFKLLWVELADACTGYKQQFVMKFTLVCLKIHLNLKSWLERSNPENKTTEDISRRT